MADDSDAQALCFGISRYALGKQPFVEISEAEYHSIVSAKQTVLHAASAEEIFDILIDSYIELEKECLTTAVDYMIRFAPSYQRVHDSRRLLARRLGNLLTACRSYLDQVPSTHEALSDDPKRALAEWKLWTGQEYDARLGYRAMESLRNYAQHRGIPIHGLGIDMRRVENDQSEHSVAMTVTVEELRKSKKFKRNVLTELEKIGPKIEIRPIICDYISGLASVHDKFRTANAGKVSAAETCVQEAISRFYTLENIPEKVRGIAVVSRRSDETFASHETLPGDLVEYRRVLVSKNARLQKLDKRYAIGRTSL